MDLAKEVTCAQSYKWDQTEWALDRGCGRQEKPKFHVVAVDFGAKYNILRCLASSGCKVIVVPATSTAREILAYEPNGVFLSNGPGDPEVVKGVPETIGKLIGKVPIFGICLGHQLLGLALGGTIKKGKVKIGDSIEIRPGKDTKKGLQPIKTKITTYNHKLSLDLSGILLNKIMNILS